MLLHVELACIILIKPRWTAILYGAAEPQSFTGRDDYA